MDVMMSPSVGFFKQYDGPHTPLEDLKVLKRITGIREVIVANRGNGQEKRKFRSLHRCEATK